MGNTLNNVIILFLIEINAFFEQKIRKNFPKLLIERALQTRALQG